jgi:hypothetical protein
MNENLFLRRGVPAGTGCAAQLPANRSVRDMWPSDDDDRVDSALLARFPRLPTRSPVWADVVWVYVCVSM